MSVKGCFEGKGSGGDGIIEGEVVMRWLLDGASGSLVASAVRCCVAIASGANEQNHLVTCHSADADVILRTKTGLHF